MKILITGSKGFVGTHLTRRLKEKHEVVSYDLKEGRDIFNQKLLDKYFKGVDVVIHLAAFVSGIESWDKPEAYLLNNGIGTLKVIKSAIADGVRKIIIFSSAAVYGDPLTPYGASKILAETIAKSYKDQIEVIIVRPFNIYGNGQNLAYGYVIHNFADGIKNKGQIEIYGTGNQTRDFIFIDDVINVVEKMIKGKSPSKPVDLGTGRDIKITNLAKIIAKILNKDYQINYLKPRKELLKSVADTRVLKSLGIDSSNFIDLEKGLRKIL